MPLNPTLATHLTTWAFQQAAETLTTEPPDIQDRVIALAQTWGDHYRKNGPGVPFIPPWTETLIATVVGTLMHPTLDGSALLIAGGKAPTPVTEEPPITEPEAADPPPPQSATDAHISAQAASHHVAT